MDLFYSPEQPPVMLSSQHLYVNISVEVAAYDDCFLFVSGGENATVANLGANDTFILGNYDLALATVTLLGLYAENGNITTFAACGSLNECPVMNAVDGTNKTDIGLRFCIGGPEVGFAAWGV